jgi:hypothetical protein
MRTLTTPLTWENSDHFLGLETESDDCPAVEALIPDSMLALARNLIMARPLE